MSMDSLDFFTGRCQLTMDAKGRISMPASWRPLLSGDKDETKKKETKIFLYKDFENPAVHLYLPEVYAGIANAFNTLSTYDAKAKRVRLLFFGESEECLLRGERQMLLLNQNLRDHLGCAVGEQVDLVGQGDHATFWHPDRLQESIEGKPVKGVRPPPMTPEEFELAFQPKFSPGRGVV